MIKPKITRKKPAPVEEMAGDGLQGSERGANTEEQHKDANEEGRKDANAVQPVTSQTAFASLRSTCEISEPEDKFLNQPIPTKAERCKRIVAAIETLSQTEIEELFRMIHKEKYEYTRTNHGVFINLSWISDEMLNQMEQYIQFCRRSKDELKKYESICDLLNHKMAEDREKQLANIPTHRVATLLNQEDSVSTPPSVEEKPKVSTSMRFYLLKKRFSKMNTSISSFEIDLKPDNYILSQ